MAAVVFDEIGREAVERRLADAALFAPSLFRFEMANVCLKKMRAHVDERETLLEAFRDFATLPVTEIDVDLAETIALARDTRLSLYDASYLWLALHLKIELVTLDEKLDKAHRKLARA
jgi:predicted nucleic acid-binding protein